MPKSYVIDRDGQSFYVLRDGISGSVSGNMLAGFYTRQVEGNCKHPRKENRATYTLMLVALYDDKGPLVLMILHHELGDRLMVFAVYIASFDELVVQFGDGWWNLHPPKVPLLLTHAPIRQTRASTW